MRSKTKFLNITDSNKKKILKAIALLKSNDYNVYEKKDAK